MQFLYILYNSWHCLLYQSSYWVWNLHLGFGFTFPWWLMILSIFCVGPLCIFFENPLAIFKLDYLSFYCLVLRVLYVFLYKSSLSGTWLTNISLHFVVYLFTFSTVFLELPKSLILMRSNLSFFFAVCAFEKPWSNTRLLRNLIWETVVWFKVRKTYKYVLLSGFIILAPTFRSIIHVELIYIWYQAGVQHHFLNLWPSSWPSTTSWRDHSFSIVWNWHQC